MRPDEERALYGFTDDDGRPDPANAQTAAEYVALLGAFVEASGLSLPEIEELARSKGYILPEKILVTALSDDALPPERLVVALVRSIGINDREVKYWAEALWRLESRTAYDPDQEPWPEYEREAPYDIGQIDATEDEREPAEPYVVPAPYTVGHVPVADEAYEEPCAAQVHDGAGLFPDADEWYKEGPQPYRTRQDARVGDDHDAEPWPAEQQPYGVAPEYEHGGYDEFDVETAPTRPVDSRSYSEDAPHASNERRSRSVRTGPHRLAGRDDDSEDDGAGYRGDERPVRHEEARDGRRVRRERPRIRGSASPSTDRAGRRSKVPLPVAVGLSALLGVTVVGWMVIGGGGGGQVPGDNAAVPPPARSAGTTVSGGGLPSEVPVVVPGGSVTPPTGPSGQPITQGPQPGAQPTMQGPQPGAQPTTQGPQPARTYNTALSGTGGTTCSREGGQWRVRISVAVTVSDPPPGVSPLGQGGPSGSMQSFSLSGGGSSFGGSTTVAVGPDSSPNVGTVQWVVTMTVPGGQTVRDENYEGYSCA